MVVTPCDKERCIHYAGWEIDSKKMKYKPKSGLQTIAMPLFLPCQYCAHFGRPDLYEEEEE